MKKTLATIAIAGLLAGCAVSRQQETVGQYIDDTTITTQVKARFADDATVAATSIRVETLRGQVQLSGFAKSDHGEGAALAWGPPPMGGWFEGIAGLGAAGAWAQDARDRHRREVARRVGALMVGAILPGKGRHRLIGGKPAGGLRDRFSACGYVVCRRRSGASLSARSHIVMPMIVAYRRMFAEDGRRS